jgi:hypothetical protein
MSVTHWEDEELEIEIGENAVEELAEARKGLIAKALKAGLCGRLGFGAVGRVRVWCADDVRRGPARGRGCQSRVVRTGRACRFTHGRHKSTR